MKTIKVTPEEMSARVARYDDLVPYGNQHTEAIDPAVFERLTAKRVLSIMAPRNYNGRSSRAPLKGEPGAVISIAELPPGNAPALHCHEETVENFFVLNGRIEVKWGDHGEDSIELGPLDFISIPPGVNRTFVNISDEYVRVLAIIQPVTEKQEDRVAFARSVEGEIARDFSPETVQSLKNIGFHFDAGEA